jgi:single-stranded DNA-binding protein
MQDGQTGPVCGWRAHSANCYNFQAVVSGRKRGKGQAVSVVGKIQQSETRSRRCRGDRVVAVGLVASIGESLRPKIK